MKRIRRLLRLLPGFARSRSGTAAVEFSLLALPFFLIVYALIEVALMFTAELVLDKATAATGRLVRVGQVQRNSLSQSEFRTLACGNVSALLDCDKLVFDLRTYSSFDDVPTTIPMDGDAIDTSGFAYDYGRGGTIVALRVFYKWPILTGPMREFFAHTGDGATVLMSMSTFRTEPF
ncbi:pilus assembly protein [Aureimonas flava]|uniref:Pilus assembly protein n=1 Tax=Aureimonas flava TaxID=2320271 RepID=A0A3A1WN05_9HYPH|nr:TadE/TadG family type IV pilus assembly protein [Aureimonas flava]RIY03277.1 pilus assembly protein [Aureimonas flava]